MSIKFDDGADWLQKRLDGVASGYSVPDYFNGDGICIDIGANVGAFPLVYGNMFSKVFCYEPALYTYNECVKNVKDLKNVSVYNLAVTNESNKTVKLKSHKSGNVSGNASILDSVEWDENNYEYVKTISLAEVIENAKIKGVKNYVKIDTEGSEYDMLRSCDISMIDFLAVEIHLQLGVRKINELFVYLSENFRIYHEVGGGNKHHEIIYINRKLNLA
jgi:FkbM family methyltransferase